MINKSKILEILYNVEKMISQSLHVPVKMEELFNIVDINQNELLFEDGSLSYFFDIDPISFDGLTNSEYLEEIDKISSVLDIIDSDTIVSFMTISDHKKDYIKNSLANNKKENMFINKSINSRLEHIENKTYLTYRFSIKFINITENRKGFYDPEEFEKIAEIKKSELIDIIGKYFRIKETSTEDLLLLMNNIFNPNERESFYDTSSIKKSFEHYENSLVRLLAKTYIKDDGKKLEFNDTYGRVFNLSKPPANPNDLSIFSTLDYLDSVSEIDFIMTINIRKDDSANQKIQRKGKLANTTLASWFSSTNKKISESAENYINFVEEKHYKTMAISVSLGLMADTEEELKKHSNKIQKPFGWKNCTILQNNYAAIQEWFALFPGVYNRGFYEFYTSSYHASFLTNLVAPLNTNSKTFNMLFEDKRGNLINYNLLSEKHTLFGGIVFAPPGKGKSAFLNYILYIYYMTFLQKGKLNSFILDFGGSYYSLVSLMNKYLTDDKKIIYQDLKIEPNKFYNPFDVEFGAEIDIDMITKKVGLVLAFFKAALKNNIDQAEEAILTMAIKKVLEKFLLDENDPELKLPALNHFDIEAEIDEIPCIIQYKSGGRKDVDMFLGAMPNLSDMVKLISTDQTIKQTFSEEIRHELHNKITYFTATEIGSLFARNSTQLITGKNIVIDMKSVVESDSSGFNLLLFYIYFIQDSWLRFTNKDLLSEKKLYIIDEYNQFATKSPVINEFSKMCYKTGRKEGVDMFLASQNISDFPKSFFNLIGHAIMFEPNNEDERKEIQEVMGLTSEEKDILKKIKTIKGKYSEMFIISNSDEGRIKNSIKFRITPYEYWAFITTTPFERAVKFRLEEDGVEISEAIEYLSSTYPEGLNRIIIDDKDIFLNQLKKNYNKWKELN